MQKEVDEKIVSLLDKLIATCKDSENAYHAAAEKAQAKELKRFFRQCAGQRARFAAELQEEVYRHGALPPRRGTVGGALHRRWLRLKSVFLGAGEARLLAECERGEEAALRRYEAPAHEVLPPELQELVAKQYRDVKRARDRLRALQEQAGTSPAQGPTNVSSP